MTDRGRHHTTAPARGRGTPQPGARLRTSVDQYDISPRGAHEACGALFLGEVEGRGLRWVERASATRAEVFVPDLDSLGTVELSWRAPDSHDAFLRLGDDLIGLLTSRYGGIEITVAGRSADAVHEAAASIAARLRSEPPPQSDEVIVHFWAQGSHGPSASPRAITAPHWADVKDNYSARARRELEHLSALREPEGGSLVLWHGPPGTGKTHALRALAREWRAWCTVHYITDPESFLGRSTRYLMSVAAGDGGDDDLWRLIVLEDAGELMAADARASTGQGLSRLLNLTDGLLGQGGRCLLLVTTNEPVGRLHPAVRRPGRCLALVELGALSAGEANAWLHAHDSSASADRPMTLAELFALVSEVPSPVADAEPGAGVGVFGFSRALATSPSRSSPEST